MSNLSKSFKTITQTPATREKCKYCGSEQEWSCGFFYEDLCPDKDPNALKKARERYAEEP